MANPYIGWVNLQMVSVRHHLSLLVEENNANERLRNRGVLESAAWHLQRAYCYYLYELGSNYQLSAPENNGSADLLCQALESVGKHPGEAAELRELENDGWVGDLYRTLESIDRPAPTQAVPAQAEALNLVDLDKASAVLTADLLSDWLSRFKELIGRHRDVMVEY